MLPLIISGSFFRSPKAANGNPQLATDVKESNSPLKKKKRKRSWTDIFVPHYYDTTQIQVTVIGI